jgi:hypothetical protein
MNSKKYSSAYYFHMVSKYKFSAGLLIIVLLICKCSSALYKPGIYDAQKYGTSLDTLIAGRKLYIEKCASCHTIYLPEKYTRQEWKHHIDRMYDRSGITTEEKNTILKYLESGSKK